MTTPAEKLAKAAHGSAWPFKDVACHNQSIDRVRVALAELCETTNKRYPSVPYFKSGQYAQGFLHGWGNALEALQQPYEDEPMPEKTGDVDVIEEIIRAYYDGINQEDPTTATFNESRRKYAEDVDAGLAAARKRATELGLIPPRGKVMKGLTWAEGYPLLESGEYVYWTWSGGDLVRKFSRDYSVMLCHAFGKTIDISTTAYFDGEVVTK